MKISDSRDDLTEQSAETKALLCRCKHSNPYKGTSEGTNQKPAANSYQGPDKRADQDSDANAHQSPDQRADQSPDANPYQGPSSPTTWSDVVLKIILNVIWFGHFHPFMIYNETK